MKNQKAIIGVIVAVVVGVIVFFMTRGYSKNVQEVRSWQNAILRDKNVTLGEVMDYALKDSSWTDTKYNGEDAVQLTGTFKKDNKSLKVIFYVDREKHRDMYAYYEKDGVKGTSANIAFDATNYANETAKALGRTK